MTIKNEEVSKIAYLARLQLPSSGQDGSNGEADSKIVNDLNQILGFVEQMQGVDTSDVAPLSNPLEQIQPLRADTVTESDEREQLQSVAPATEKGLFLVPRVIE